MTFRNNFFRSEFSHRYFLGMLYKLPIFYFIFKFFIPKYTILQYYGHLSQNQQVFLATTHDRMNACQLNVGLYKCGSSKCTLKNYWRIESQVIKHFFPFSILHTTFERVTRFLYEEMLLLAPLLTPYQGCFFNILKST